MNEEPIIDIQSDEYFMQDAIRQAVKAYEADEVPVGAVIVRNGRVLARAWNQVEMLNDATAHAEMLALTAAEAAVGDWRLNDCTLYVTKEPCPMCAGAIINARVSKLVFGSYDDKKGCCGSLYQLCGDKRLESITAVKGGIMEEQCSAILKEFFRSRRD